MTDFWHFLVETNLLSFSIFAVIIYIASSRLLEKAWMDRNASINEALEKSLLARTEAEQKLAEANARFQSFQQELVQMKAEQKQMISSLKSTLAAENEERISDMRKRYEREIERIRAKSIEEIKNKAILLATEMIKDKLLQDSKLQGETQNKSLQEIISS